MPVRRLFRLKVSLSGTRAGGRTCICNFNGHGKGANAMEGGHNEFRDEKASEIFYLNAAI